MDIKPGFAFLMHDGSGKEHLYIVISDCNENTGRVVLVSFSTWNEQSDNSCVLKAGDHPFISHKTCVSYENASLKLVSAIEVAVDNDTITPHSPVDHEIMLRIFEGAEKSNRLPLGCKEVLIEQGLI